MADTSDLEARLRRQVQKYAAKGVRRPRILLDLTLAGHPPDVLQRIFPDIPAAFAAQPDVTPSVIGPPAPQRIKPSAPFDAAPSRTAPAPPVSQWLPRPLPGEEGQPPEPVSFQFVPLIQCSYPHTDPGTLQAFVRRNGWLEVRLGTTRPDCGLPYGIPARLLTIYLTTQAIRTQSPEIFLGESINDFLRRLDVAISRGPRGSLRSYTDQLLRLIFSHISIDEKVVESSGRTGLALRQALFVKEARLWWDDDQCVDTGTIVLSDDIFQSILARSAPVSTGAIKALRKSPMDLDVYMWLVHRLYRLSKPSPVTWQQLSEQFGHGYRNPRQFRQHFLASLKKVLSIYEQAQVRPMGETGLLLLPSRPHLQRPSN